MPHSRRRKFSVRNGIASREQSKVQNNLQTSAPDFDKEVIALALTNNVIALKSSNSLRHFCSGPGHGQENKAKMYGKINSKNNNKMHSNSTSRDTIVCQVSECSISPSLATIKKNSNSTIGKSFTESSSIIDFDKHYLENVSIVDSSETSQRVTQEATDRASLKKEKYPRQHRIKVRSPRRRTGVGISETHNKISDPKKFVFNIGTEAIDWEHEEVNERNVAIEAETIEDDERQSDHSSDDMCRICHGGETLSHDLGPLISACSCRGTVGRVHVKCLERWLTESGKSRCELCGTRYATRRVHRYGVPRALIMWILSQNAKQLMVDSLGIMLMSPLAVLAAWLSGRTLAGLMTQDSRATPWPLASTFVLACMTLVCYYCWIVSAATRHALGWWIWYRSQYEVRLQLLDAED